MKLIAEPEDGHDDDRSEIRDEQRPVAAVDRVVDGALHEDRNQEREPREDEGAREADRDEACLRPPERVEVADRRPESEIGRIDVLHGVLPPSATVRREALGPMEPPRDAGR